MAELNVKKADDSKYEVGKKYRYVDFAKQGLSPQLNKTVGLKMDEILDGHDLEQMLNVYLDERGIWTMNINSSFYVLGLPDAVVSVYQPPTDMRWPSISYAIYGTTRLAWLLMKLNGVYGDTIFDAVPAGQLVRYLDKIKYVEPILGSIRENESEING